MKIATVITTYNRPKLFERTVRQLIREAKLYGEHTVLVAEDGSDPRYAYRLSKRFKEEGIEHVVQEQPINFGKEKYWFLLNEIYEELIHVDYDYLVQIPDDLQLTPNFYRRAVKLFENIDDPKKVCLNLYRDRREEVWGSHKPRTVHFSGITYRDAGWVDMCYVAGRDFMQCLNHELRPVQRDWYRMPELGSGVGSQISRRLRDQGRRLYQVNNSLVLDDGQHPSVMNANQTTPKLMTL